MLLSNQGSFPPPALPGICGNTSPSATLPARPAPHGVPVGVCAPPTGLPVLLPSPSSMRAAATTPAEPADARVARFPAGGSLPRQKGGSASALLVSGPAQRSLALQPAWSLSRPRRPRYIGVLQAMSLPPSPAPIATGWSDSCRAGFAPARRRRFPRRTDDESYLDKNSGDKMDRTEWHRIVTFQDGLVEMMEKHAKKGRLVYVSASCRPASGARTARTATGSRPRSSWSPAAGAIS